jgi:DNA-directed RNA polymerase subunit H
MANPIHVNQLVVCNILEMMKCRRYIYNPIYDTMISDYDAMYTHMNDNKEMMVIVGRRDRHGTADPSTNDEICIFNIHGVEKFNADRRVIVERIYKDRRAGQKAGLLEVLIITRQQVAEKKRNEMMAVNYMPDIHLRVGFFTYGEMRFNILEHDLNSRYEPLTREEASQVLESLRATRQEIHQIPDTDLSIRYIGASPGDIVRIIRPSATAGTAVVYARVTGVPYVRAARTEK